MDVKCEKQLLDIRCERFKMACVTGDVFLLRRSGLKPGRTLAIAQHLKQWQARALMLYWLVACVAGWLVGRESGVSQPTNKPCALKINTTVLHKRLWPLTRPPSKTANPLSTTNFLSRTGQPRNPQTSQPRMEYRLHVKPNAHINLGWFGFELGLQACHGRKALTRASRIIINIGA